MSTCITYLFSLNLVVRCAIFFYFLNQRTLLNTALVLPVFQDRDYFVLPSSFQISALCKSITFTMHKSLHFYGVVITITYCDILSFSQVFSGVQDYFAYVKLPIQLLSYSLPSFWHLRLIAIEERTLTGLSQDCETVQKILDGLLDPIHMIARWRIERNFLPEQTSRNTGRYICCSFIFCFSCLKKHFNCHKITHSLSLMNSLCNYFFFTVFSVYVSSDFTEYLHIK